MVDVRFHNYFLGFKQPKQGAVKIHKWRLIIIMGITKIIWIGPIGNMGTSQRNMMLDWEPIFNGFYLSIYIPIPKNLKTKRTSMNLMAPSAPRCRRSRVFPRPLCHHPPRSQPPSPTGPELKPGDPPETMGAMVMKGRNCDENKRSLCCF